jgi:hypothetical protein
VLPSGFVWATVLLIAALLIVALELGRRGIEWVQRAREGAGVPPFVRHLT